MKKRVLSLILALCMALSLVPASALAAGDFEVVDGVLVSYNGAGGDVVIPSNVTAIGQRVFAPKNPWDETRFTSVTIPDSVVTIGYGAFDGRSDLTEITIPNSVTTIEGLAFNNCTGLTELTLPDSVTTLGRDAFYGCEGLTSLTLSGSIETLWGFGNCKNLTEVDIPAGVTAIGDMAFAMCDKLEKVTIPDTVTSIGDSAFQGCRSLTTMVLPSSVTSMNGEYIFTGCENMTGVLIPPSVTQFGPGIFGNVYTGSCPATVYGVIGSEAEKQFADRFLPGMPGEPAYASTQMVNVNGAAVEFQMYALKDMNGNLTNYVKLRDVANVLNGTAAQFAVGYADGAVTADKGQPYAANGSEMKTPYTGDREYERNSGGLTVNGQTRQLVALTLTDDQGGGYNYFKLRDLGEALGFTVGWSAEKGVYIETD